jgi:hypothetical protein
MLVVDSSQPGQISKAYLCVVSSIALAVAPSTDPDVQLAVGKSANELFELWEVLGGVDADDLAVMLVDTVLQSVLAVSIELLPGGVEVLHKVRVALARAGIANLLHGHVAAGTDDDGDIKEVIAAEACEGVGGSVPDPVGG